MPKLEDTKSNWWHIGGEFLGLLHSSILPCFYSQMLVPALRIYEQQQSIIWKCEPSCKVLYFVISHFKFNLLFLQKPIYPSDLYRSIRDSQLTGMSGYSKAVFSSLPMLFYRNARKIIRRYCYMRTAFISICFNSNSY